MKRRDFLYGCSATAALLSLGCNRPRPSQPLTLLEVEPGTGKAVAERSIDFPAEKWNNLPSAPFGFLFSNPRTLLTLTSQTAQLKEFAGPTEGLWVKPELLMAGQKVSGEEYQLSALEIPSGKVRWSARLGYSQVLGANPTCVFVAHPAGLSAFDLETGKELWKNPAVLDVKAHFLGTDSLLVSVGNGGNVQWLDPASGKIQRQLPPNKQSNRVIVVASDGPYSLVFTRRVAVFGYRAHSDKPIWKFPVGSEEFESELIACAEAVALIQVDNSTLALDLPSGKPLWKAGLCRNAQVCQGTVLLSRPQASPEGKTVVTLEAKALKSGQTLWKKTSHHANTACLAGGKTFVLLGAHFSS